MYLIAFLVLLLGWTVLITRQLLKKDFYNLLAVTAVICFITAPILAFVERFN